jgi:hypothetical protein
LVSGISNSVTNPPKKPEPGDMVILLEAVPGLLEGLPSADQKAIAEVVGKPILFVGYDETGRAELEFTDGRGEIHSIYVSPEIMKAPE